VTRELKLALIVGFALVLVVTVLISDHLSHARQTRLASLPPDPVKMTEPPLIALEAGAESLPRQAVVEPTPVAPAPLINSSPMSDVEPVVISQGSASSMLAPPTPAPSPLTGLTTPAAEPQRVAQPQVSQPQDRPIIARQSDSLVEEIQRQGGRVTNDTIYLPGVQVSREQVREPLAPAPAPVPAPAPATSDRIHTVVSGDSLYKLAAQYYGDGKVWRKVAKYNGINDESAPLRVGQKLKFPAAEVLLGRAPTPAEAAGLAAAKPAPAKAAKTRPYVIRKGDTLAEIAQRELGTVKRAREILELNKDVIKSADRIPLGATIQLPG